MTLAYGLIAIGVAALVVLNTWLVARETRRGILQGIEAGARLSGYHGEIVTEADAREADKFDQLPEETT